MNDAIIVAVGGRGSGFPWVAALPVGGPLFAQESALHVVHQHAPYANALTVVSRALRPDGPADQRAHSNRQ